ncbi:hypothetical protein [Haloarcula japonica]|uniref:Uncharacterized protein n=1 Tax=Haloarcula japonica (strain ATCC 49778 / DSM 6131 / JCM 7785 / NBRC 101032 / NCIMB 13157 / TR-1) TaxID=1227453 RepID=M0L9C2_HALJT|nr:hypothetical protein [Haloarcula japonica]EMA29693.1 hypothetical protein C444_12877 [Haloarcula japonica DSM 6131]
MVPAPPALSRRRLLGGLGSLCAAAGTVAVGLTKPAVLPDVLTDEATKHYPTPPEVSAHWQPTVTESHAQAVIDLLAETVEEGKQLWSQLDTNRPFTGAGGWLEDARQALRDGDTNEALSDATYGLQFAAADLGEARAELGNADLQALATQAIALRDRSRKVASNITPYLVDDPGTDLAWYLRIEQEAMIGKHLATWDGMQSAAEGIENNNGGTSTSHDYGDLVADVLVAQVHVRAAERFRDLLAEARSESATSHTEQLQTAANQFRTRLEGAPTAEEIQSRYGVNDPESVGPYEVAHIDLARWCFPSGVPTPWTIDVEEGLLVSTAVGLSKGVARIRAHEFAVDHLVVEQGDGGFDSGHALAEKRRARRVHEQVIGSDPPPLLTRQAARAIEDLQVAVVGFADSYEQPMWRERLDTYLYALLGRAKLKQYPAVYRTVVGED